MSDGIELAAIIQGICSVVAAGLTGFALIRTALTKLMAAQAAERDEHEKRAKAERAEQERRAELERAEQQRRAEQEKAEHREVLKAELRRGLGPIRRRLATLEGAVDVLLRAGHLQRPEQKKPPRRPRSRE